MEGKNNPRQQLLRFIKSEYPKSAGIVYCLSRKRTEETAAFLRTEGIDALCYHAGMDSGSRAKHMQRFIVDESVVMVATIAFGMGIDKPDVRFVAHLDMPKSMQAETACHPLHGWFMACKMLFPYSKCSGALRLVRISYK